MLNAGCVRNADRRPHFPAPPARHHAHDLLHVVDRGRLVERDADGVLRVQEIDAGGLGGLSHDGGIGPLHAQRVEVRRVGLAQPGVGQRVLESTREMVDAFRDRANAGRAVEDRIHRRDVGEERLRRADVRGRLFAADVLLSGLQRHAICALAAGVN